MKAAILVEQRHPLELGTLEVPRLHYGQVLVRMLYSGICGSQIGEIDGVKGPDSHLPHLLGHEGTGEVIEVGDGVTRVRAGDHVVLHWRPAAGIQAGTPSYRWGNRTVKAGWVTTFNEMAVVSENRVTPIPSHLDMATAALYGCAITTGFGVVHHDARLCIGESIVVLGVGGVGLAVVLGASLAGAHPIVAVDVSSAKLEMARRYGATHTVLGGTTRVGDEIRCCLEGRGADVAVENTGRPEVIETSYEITHARGRTILVGVPPAGARISIDSMPLHFGKVMTGSHGGGSVPSDDIPRYLRMEAAGRFGLQDMISHRYELENVNLALEAMRRGEVIRAVIAMGDARAEPRAGSVGIGAGS